MTNVVLPALGFDFWAEELIVTISDGRRCVRVRDLRRIDIRPPQIEVG